MKRQLFSAFRHAKGLAQLRKDDIWMASYPRTGNTRLRMLLGQAQLLKTGSDELCLPGNVEQFMPVWGFSDFSKFNFSPRFVKTHRMYLPIMRRPKRVVFMLRDPRESIASAYRMYLSRKDVGSPEFGEFLKNPRHGIPGWIRMYQSWMPRTTSVVKYKDLMSDPVDAVSRMCEELGVDFSTEVIRKAADMTDKQNAANAEEKGGIRDGGRFDGSFKAVGPGNHALAAEYFKKHHLDYLNLELSKAGIEIDDLIGDWTSTTPAGSEKTTPVQFCSPKDIALDRIVKFFADSNVAEVTETFRAFDLSQEQATWLANYSGKDSYFLAVSNGEIAGFGMLRGWDEGYAIPSLGLFVSPAHQGKGIGKAIMNHLTETSIERSCEKIRLTVDAVNEKAVALYKAQQYEIDSEQSDEDRFVMYRQLETNVGSRR